MSSIAKEIPQAVLHAFKKKKSTPISEYINSNTELEEATDLEGNSLLHLAALHDFPEIISIYTETRPKSASNMVNCKNHHGETPIHLAVKQCHFRRDYNNYFKPDGNYEYKDLCDELRQEYAGKNKLEPSFYMNDVFCLLWALGADVNATDNNGNTPLHMTIALSTGTTNSNQGDCKNSGRDEILADIAVTLINIFGADDNKKNTQEKSFNDLMAEALKKSNLTKFVCKLAIERCDKDKIGLQEGYKALIEEHKVLKAENNKLKREIEEHKALIEERKVLKAEYKEENEKLEVEVNKLHQSDNKGSSAFWLKTSPNNPPEFKRAKSEQVSKSLSPR